MTTSAPSWASAVADCLHLHLESCRVRVHAPATLTTHLIGQLYQGMSRKGLRRHLEYIELFRSNHTWASWEDLVKMIIERHSIQSDRIHTQQVGEEARSTQRLQTLAKIKRSYCMLFEIVYVTLCDSLSI